jgi:predicted TIM-barrel fold metal-dependent hydrolase
LPLPDADLCLKEIAYALDTLKADGMRAAPSYSGKYLGDAAFDPVWAELNRRKSIVFVHPTQPQCCGPILPQAPSATLEFPFDTTRAITSLLLTGTFSKYPDLRWIFSHGGGTLPMLAGRIAGTAKFKPDVAAKLPHGPIYELQRLYVDTASAYFPYAWAGMMALNGPHRILFGTDDPYIKVADVDQGLAALHLPLALRKAVDRENALPLFPRLKSA